MMIRKSVLLLFVALSTSLSNAVAQEKMIFRDPSIQVEDRLNDLLLRMTLEEKIDMLAGYNDFYLHPVERLEVPAFEMADGPMGVASWGLKGQATAFPSTLATAASWNRELMGRMGVAIGQEWRSRGIHFWLAPGVNLYRASKGARNFEYMGEDPYLVSQMVVPLIKQVQKMGVVATVKHYAANEQEFDRYTVSSEVDERTLREIYLPPFRAAVQEAKVWSVMTGYNPVNGEWNTQNKFLIDILKKEWGFKGFLMSDWACTYSALAAANNGLDLECGSKQWFNREQLIPLINTGEISEEIINDKVRRIFRPCFELGFFDRPQKIDTIPQYNEFANMTALLAAREGSVLLKNQNNLLPLDTKNIKKIAVIGPTAQPPMMTDRFYRDPVSVFGGGGSSKVNPWYTTYTLEGIRDIIGTEAQVLYDQGISNRYMERMYQQSQFWIDDQVCGTKVSYYQNASDKTSLGGDTLYWKRNSGLNYKSVLNSEAYKDCIIQFSSYIIPVRTGEANFFVNAEGAYRLFVNDSLVADQSDSQSYASSVVPYSFEKGKKMEVRLEFEQTCNYPNVRLGYDYKLDFTNSEAVRIAKEADVVVYCAGFDHKIEFEGEDRSFELPYGQDLLLSEVLKVNPKTTVVLIGGGGIDMQQWEHKTPAILHAWYPGMEGGKAIAEILFGEVNPSGKLPITIEKKWEDSPAYGNYDEERGTGKVHYREGIFMGYRHYDINAIEPLFPFGHGLSYTTFELSNLMLDKNRMKANDILKISLSVKNTGEKAGAEVIQLYVTKEKSSVERPIQELKGFEKIFLNPGESKIIHFEIHKEGLQYFHPEEKKWEVEKGKYTIRVGNSSRNLSLQKSFLHY